MTITSDVHRDGFYTWGGPVPTEYRSLVQPSYPAARVSGGVHGLMVGLLGSAGVLGAAYYQPMVLEGVGALTLLLVVGVVFPAVWSRHATRRRAAATVLRLLLTALVGHRVAAAVTAATSEARPPVESALKP